MPRGSRRANRVSGACRLALHLVGYYRRWVSPYMGGRCRFVPSCSQYAEIALVKYGLLRGGWLIVKRIVKCHPLHKGCWYDPVP